ncbi:MAG: hypothetical protein CSA60_03595 [Neptuniibacter caesariensis]|uniref:Uncharacterized protein n=1 Tax=Neptuniibacter caesariensis TaxID=207954 RepID=A0A2G6JKP6_NEPCE|nr:MAG: hypothetical protein CSA60_03595 [Neptuniibacter caesariensis]
MMHALFNSLREHMWGNQSNYVHQKKLNERHKMLMDAILEGKSEEVRQAALQHLVYVAGALPEIE